MNLDTALDTNGDASARADQWRVRFTPLAEADLPLLHRWLNAPHVVAGYSRVPTTAEEIAAKYGPRIAGSEPVRGYVAAVDGKPIGYVQVYRVADFPDYRAAVGDGSDDAAIDVLIGEIEYTGRGLGRRVIVAAVEEIVWPVFGARNCYACPRHDNLSSVRAFTKAGFRALRPIDVANGERELLMQRARPA